MKEIQPHQLGLLIALVSLVVGGFVLSNPTCFVFAAILAALWGFAAGVYKLENDG